MSEIVQANANNGNKETQLPQAPRQEHPVEGRKVFFVNPPLNIENYLHSELKQNEYEVYIIPDYKYTKVALRKYPDALCFIFIDDGLTYDKWFNFIKSFQDEEVLKTIFVGLMSVVIPAPIKEKFMLYLSLPGGFIMLNEYKGSMLLEKILGILDFNGAKGRRKYIRLDCSKDTAISGYFVHKSQLFQVAIANISSVGIACSYPKSYGDSLAKNTYVPGFSLTLGRRSIITPSIVFDTRPLGDDKLFSVLMFTNQLDEDDRKVVKKYIFEQLQKRFELNVFEFPPDMEDYSNRNPKFANSDYMPYSPGSVSSSAASGANQQIVFDLEELDEPEEINDSEAEDPNKKMTGTSFDSLPDIEEL